VPAARATWPLAGAPTPPRGEGRRRRGGWRGPLRGAGRARAVLRALARGDEDRGRAFGHIGGVPHAGRVDRIFARRKRGCHHLPVRQFLHQHHGAVGADHHLVARRMHFPRGPAFGEGVLRDEAPFGPVARVARAIARIPFHAREGRLFHRLRAEAEVDEALREPRRVHDPSPTAAASGATMQKAFNLLPSGSRK